MSGVDETIVLMIEKNPLDIYKTGVETLLRLLDNVIRDPTNMKFRTIRLENKAIKEKLLSVKGMKGVLFSIGFQESNGDLVLPPSVLIAKIKRYREFISTRLQEIGASSTDPAPSVIVNTSSGTIPKRKPVQPSPASIPAAPVVEAPRQSVQASRPYEERIRFSKIIRSQNPMLTSFEHLSDTVMQYEDSKLLEYGKTLIPVERLTSQASEKLKAIQEAIKSEAYKAVAPSLEDLIVVELANWFNTEFFEWVNTVPCKVCGKEGGQKQFSIIENGIRVEGVNCCNDVTKFFRYNDVEQLLHSRRGRCGEYANCFTFLCRCLGYDARFVHSTFDHVWTEVFSNAQNRWIHVDPSDNVVDAPLMYHCGWKRKIDYVIAFSRDDVQDVTWRYTSNHSYTREVRKLCSETELLNVLIGIRKKRQHNINEDRKVVLKKRTLREIIELMVQRTPTENEKKGRSSGSMAWRTSRGEHTSKNYIFEATDEDLKFKQFNLRYSCSEDKYETFLKVDGTTKILQTHDGWKECNFQSNNIFRKVERDWKMAYLAREEDTLSAEITWKFDFSKTGLIIKDYTLNFETKTYENAAINVDMLSENGSPGDIRGTSTFSITAKLSGGKGDVAWQHTQLFRQSLNSHDYPFELNISFC